jgi:hypothetical protein
MRTKEIIKSQYYASLAMRDEYVSLESPDSEPENGEPYSKEEMLAYHTYCLEKMEELVETLDLEAESGFYWLPFDKLELQFYNIRHLQQHTGELSERLGTKGGIEVSWVGRLTGHAS